MMSMALYALVRVIIVKSDLLNFMAAISTLITDQSRNSVRVVVDLLSGLSSGADNLYLGSSELIRRAENPFAFLETGKEKFLSFMYLHFRYVHLLFWPINLSAEYAFDCISKVSVLYDLRNIYSVIMYLGFISISLEGVYLICFQNDAENACTESKSDHKQSLLNMKKEALLVALSWFAVTFLPASGIFLRLGTLLAERLLYLPSVGFCIFFAVILHRVASNLFKLLGATNLEQLVKPFCFCVSIVIIAMYSLRTVQRNHDWMDDRTLHLSSFTVCPQSAKLNLQVKPKTFCIFAFNENELVGC